MLKLLLLASLLNFVTPEADSVSLNIKIEDVESSDGIISLVVYRESDDFLGDRSYKEFKFNPTTPVTNIEISLPAGRYAIGVLHDLNKDDEMNFNFFNIPTEPFGISRDAASGLSKPHFDEAAFDLNESREIEIDLVHY